MEDDVLPNGTEGSPAEAAREAASADLDAAQAALMGLVSDLRDRARDALVSAEDDTEKVIIDAYERASALAGEAERSVGKLIQKRRHAAYNMYDDAKLSLYQMGATPDLNPTNIREQLAEGDFYQLAVDQILRPLAEAAGAVSTPILEPGPGDPPRPPGYPPNLAPPVSPPRPPDEPPSIPTPISPPIGGYEPGVCPPPSFILPPCPAPTVIVVPATGGPAPIPPTPIVTPPDEPEPPTEPPPVPIPPMTEPPPEDDDDEPPPLDEPPPEVAPPPRPAPRQWPRPLPPRGISNFGSPSGWTSSARCRAVEEDYLARPTPPAPGGGQPAGVIGLLGQGWDNILSPIMSGFISGMGMTPPTGWTPGSDIANALNEWGASVVAGIGGENVCVGVSSAAIASATLAQKYTGVPATYLAQGYVYDMQYCSPQFLPSQAEVDAAHIRGVIDSNLWECLTRANGNHVWARNYVVSAARATPSVGDAIALFRRGEISEADYLSLMRSNGYLSGVEALQVLAASEYVPTAPDIVRFMVRDTFDEQASDRAGLDTDFREKFQGKAKEWAKANGVTEDVFRYYWRAHWQLPSYTQAKELLHRLRPGRVDGVASFDEDDLREMLKLDDYAPGYVDQLVAASYNTITRTDIQAFYVNGAIDKAEVVERLMDTGYNRADATAIADAWSLEKANRLQNRARLWTRNNIVRQYRIGTIDRDAARKLLGRTIPNREEVESILDDADLMRNAERRGKCIKAIRRKRITGETSEQESRRELIALGLDAAVAATLAEGWTCELASMSREPSVRQLTDWFLLGIIDVGEMDKRLRNLRYSPADAKRIIDTVVLHEMERRAKQAASAAEKAERKAKAAARERERMAEKRRREEERRRKEEEEQAKRRGQ